jgi:poly(beta-D-mannuronate) lyase
MSLSKNAIYTCFGITLLGCNASSNPTAVIDNVIEQPIIEKTIDQNITCSSFTKLDFTDAFSTESAEEYSANKTIDGSFLQDSRWSVLNKPAEITLTLDTTSLVKGIAITWLNNDQRTYSYDIQTSQDNSNWSPVLTSALSNQLSTRSEYIEIAESSARYIKVIVNNNDIDQSSNIVEVEAFGCKSDVASSISLKDWYLSIPVDETLNTKAESIYEDRLNDQYFNAEFFFLNSEGGLVFRTPIEGTKTSSNTSYTRTELREMLRQGDTNINVKGINKNNWVFSSASLSEQEAAGGVDGKLTAELAVNHVTETGDRSQVGRVIIGQIHANDDEPIRVYYRKLPENEKGAIYLAHEIKGGDDIYHELIGTRSKSAVNPEDGIMLNERFGYEISVTGNLLSLTIIREGQEDIFKTVDMSESGYDLGGQYMYFKAGTYNQNNTGDPKDYVQATFYKIENTHTGYTNPIN